MKYQIHLPNDYGSEEDAAFLSEDFPELEGDELVVAAFEKIRELWPGLGELVEAEDQGGIFEASAPPPPIMPPWAWITETVTKKWMIQGLDDGGNWDESVVGNDPEANTFDSPEEATAAIPALVRAFRGDTPPPTASDFRVVERN